VQHVLENCDKEVREASKALDRGKIFVKCSIYVRIQCKNIYVRNLIECKVEEHEKEFVHGMGIG